MEASALDFPNKISDSPLTPQTPGRNLCENRLLFWGQDKDPICWFISILVTTFYSQKLRRKLFKAAKNWHLTGRNNRIFNVLHHILYHKYVKSKNAIKDVKILNHYSPLRLLQLIKSYDPSYFFDIENYMNGYVPEYYIKYFYDIIGIDCIMVDVYPQNKTIYSLYNKVLVVNENKVKISAFDKDFVDHELSKTPDVLIVAVHSKMFNNELNFIDCDTDVKTLQHYNLSDENKANISSLQDMIMYNNKVYKLDAVILSNWNARKNGHVIAGLTCKEKKYIYNGWTNETLDDTDKHILVPCKLQRHDWKVDAEGRKNRFCLKRGTCSYEEENIRDRSCFSFGMGPRILLYVRTSENVNSISDYQSFNPENQTPSFLNPSFSSASISGQSRQHGQIDISKRNRPFSSSYGNISPKTKKPR